MGRNPVDSNRRIKDIRVALPPTGSTVRDVNRNQYGQVVARSGRECHVKFLDGSQRVVFASQLEVIRKVRNLY